MFSSIGGSTLVKPIVVPRADTAVIDRSVANSGDERPFLSAFAAPCKGGQYYSGGQSAIYLYILKWSVFSDCCAVRNEDPSTCDVSAILSFLQELLYKGRTPFTIKSICGSHRGESHPGGRSVCRKE